MVRNPIAYFFQKAAPRAAGGPSPAGSSRRSARWTAYAWPVRILFWVSVEFLLPAVAMGTIGPVVAKLAVERVRARTKGTGAAIGRVYAWGMVGSILGTFLAGFFLINVFGTKGVILLLATMLAITATVLGKVRHAAWAGIPMGLCVIAFLPSILPEKSGVKAINNARAFLVSRAASGACARRPTTSSPGEVRHRLPRREQLLLHQDHQRAPDRGRPEAHPRPRQPHPRLLHQGPARAARLRLRAHLRPGHPSRDAGEGAGREGRGRGDDAALHPVPRGRLLHLPALPPGRLPKTTADVAEIDPAVTEANHLALWLPRDTTIKTTWGDARQFVDNRRNATKYDLVFGDAFNDFSVPWHLTTSEFNDRVNGLLSDDGVYMINIIDKYLSDRKAVFDALSSRARRSSSRRRSRRPAPRTRTACPRRS